MKTGVILAAGLGKRLTNDGIKPLATVDNIELLLRTIRSHEIAGCVRIVIVLGWKADVIQRYIDSRYIGSVKLIFTDNQHYNLQNGISVLCASAYVHDDEFLLTMADHVLDDKIMQMVRKHKPPLNGATLCVDFKVNTIFDIDDATKVREQGGRIQNIGKEIENYNCIDTGVFVGTSGLFNAINQIYQKNGDASLTDGVQVLADAGKMEALDIKQAYWQDVDTPEMLEHAEELLRRQMKN
jgi:choline kinase